MGPLAMSAALHGTAFFALMHAPEIKLPEPSKSEYKQAIEGKEQKLVWYRFKELPEVTPPRAKSEQKPLRAEVQSKQQIVASRRNAPKKLQMVWTPAPDIETKPVELPNILAVRMPEIKKPFVTPPDVVKPEEAKIEMAAEAPAMQSPALDPVKLTEAPKIVKRFTAPPRRVPEKITEIVRVDAAPPLEPNVSEAPELSYSLKTPTRPFIAPTRRAEGKVREIVHAGEAPDVEGHEIAAPELDASMKGITRPFKAPPAARRTGLVGKAAVPDAPEIDFANSRDLNLAVAGLNPANVPITLPQNSSPGQFSAGPKIHPDGTDSAGEGKGLSVPDLYVRGNRDTKADLIAQTFAAPTSEIALHNAARLSDLKPAAEAPHEHDSDVSGAVKVSNAPDPRFTGRDIYMMAIQMPNLTSYSGSWLMWYAARTAREAGLAPISPPVAHRKVDPKYVATAIADKIEGKVQLACVIGTDGRVSNVELVRGLDDRLNASAEEAMAKWEFTPATRRGEPVAVDVLVEIPFHLQPPAPKPYTR